MRRVAADTLVARINDRTGFGLSVEGIAHHGESGGAVYVRWSDGRQGVVTRAQAPAERMRSTAEVLASMRARGLPVPRHELLVELTDGTFVVQERLPGRPAVRIDPATVDAMVEMNERFAGVLAGRRDVPAPTLRHAAADESRYDQTLGTHSGRTRRLLERIRDIGGRLDQDMVGDDLIHPDYSLGNILYDGAGRVSGVVDWNLGAARGDRRFALVKLRIDLSWDYSTFITMPEQASYRIDPAAMRRMDDHLASSLGSSDASRIYWAHWILTHLHQAIADHAPVPTVEVFVGLGEANLT